MSTKLLKPHGSCRGRLVVLAQAPIILLFVTSTKSTLQVQVQVQVQLHFPQTNQAVSKRPGIGKAEADIDINHLLCL